MVAGFLAMTADLLHIQNQRAMQARVASLHALVQAAKGTAADLLQEEEAGRITHQAALDSFRGALHAMRYGSGDYLFAYTMDGTVVAMPPQPQIEGENRLDLTDPSGHYVVRDLIGAAANGGGVTQTLYPRPGTTVPVPKLNYIEPFEPWNILIGTGVFIDDLQADEWALLLRTATAATVAIGLAAALAWLLGRSVSHPLRRLEHEMTALAVGDLSIVIADHQRGDEIGRMARAVEVFKTAAEEKQAMEAARIHAEHEARTKQRHLAGEVADKLQTQLGQVAGALQTAAQKLIGSAGEMRSAAQRADEEAVSAKTLVDGTASNVATVAGATEQLASSVTEISGQVARSSVIAIRAVEEARRTDGLVQALAETAARVGGIVQVINGIAGQTNLLALNATIEAARAGDAGKGFAVVASEVKSLASQTAKATDEIAAQIQQIQAATSDAVKAIGSIGATIDEISQLSGGIAAAVEEQGAATQEISRNVRQAASFTQDVSRRIAGTSQAVSAAGGSAADVLTAAEALSVQSRMLTEQLGRLVDQVRAA